MKFKKNKLKNKYSKKMGIYQPLSDRNSYLIFPPDSIVSIPLKSDFNSEENVTFMLILYTYDKQSCKNS